MTSIEIVLFWRGKEVLRGMATRACAIETARAFVVGEFAGRFAESAWDSLARQRSEFLSGKRNTFAARYEDETGAASAILTAKGV